MFLKIDTFLKISEKFKFLSSNIILCYKLIFKNIKKLYQSELKKVS